MAGSDQPGRGRPIPPRVRVAVQPGAHAGSRQFGSWVRATSRAPLPPLLRGVVEQAMVAGPIFGVLSALYTAHLAQSSPLLPDPNTHAVLLQVQSWHTHFLRNYYITPEQNTLSWILAAPAIAWIVLLVPVLVGLGIRSHYAKQRR